jgi:hypothetical protein
MSAHLASVLEIFLVFGSVLGLALLELARLRCSLRRDRDRQRQPGGIRPE